MCVRACVCAGLHGRGQITAACFGPLTVYSPATSKRHFKDFKHIMLSNRNSPLPLLHHLLKVCVGGVGVGGGSSGIC